MTQTVCLLVDGDNISAKFAPQIQGIARVIGDPSIARVYTDTRHANDWLGAAGFRVFHAGSGKNAADMLLTIDAVEMALDKGVQQFVIASSDSDFSHVALRLREWGCSVHGVGEVKAPATFRLACTLFHEVGSVKSVAAPIQKPIAENISALDRQIYQIIAAHTEGAKGITITLLGSEMAKAHGFRIGTHPDKNWRGYLSKRPELFSLDPKGPEARVRYIPKGFIHAA